MNAFVYGPQFKLNRYTSEAERATMRGYDYVPEALLPYEGLTSGANVDLGFVRLFAEKLDLAIADFPADGEGGRFYFSDINRPQEFVLKDDQNGNEPMNLGNAEDTLNNLHPKLNDRPVTIGDIALVTIEGIQYRRRVLDIKKTILPSEYGDFGCSTVASTDTAILSDDIDGSLNSLVESDGDPNPANAPGTVVVTDNGGYKTKFAEAGSSFDTKLAERFTVWATEKLDTTAANDVGTVRVRTASGNFNDDYTATVANGNITIDIDDAGLQVVLTGVEELFVGDYFSWTTIAAYTTIDCDGAAISGQQASTNIVVSGVYSHNRDTVITALCTTGGDSADAEWQISDSNGLEEVLTVSGTELEAGTSFGMTGLTIKIRSLDSGLHRNGDVFTVQCIAEGPRGVDAIIVLSAPAGDPDSFANPTGTPFDMEFRKVFSGEVSQRGIEAPSLQWTATEEGVQIRDDLYIIDHTFPTPKLLPVMEDDVAGAKLFVHYRELIPAKPNEKIVKVSRPHELAQFGDKDVDNPLGFGLSAALSGANGKPVYVGRVRTNDLAGFRGVLKKAENLEFLYAHAPMTNDYEVQLAVRDHVDLMSNETNKKWRRAYVATTAVEDYRVLGYDIDQNPYTGTVTSDGNGNVVVHDPRGQFVQAKVRHGDRLRINFSSDSWGDDVYDEMLEGGYMVHEVIDEETLILATGPDRPYKTPRRYEIWKPDTADNIAIFVAARSSSFGSRRVSNVFTDGAQYLTDNDEFIELPNMYIAAEIAGLRSAVLPQQGLTHTEIALVSSAELMFTKYDDAQLNLIAANGSFIVTQDYEDGPRFIRHQLTTKSDLGNLYYEDSVGVNVDAISFEVKYTLRPYIGRTNVTPTTLRAIFNDMFRILSNATSEPGFGRTIGPQLISFENLNVAIDDVYKDRINVDAQLNVPLPLNVIDVTLHAVASFNEGQLSLESFGITTPVSQSAATQSLFDKNGNVIAVGYELPDVGNVALPTS